MFSDADIAMANLEGPVKDAFTYHEHGFTFTGDPRLLNGLADAGLDFASLANNHIGNGGAGRAARHDQHLDSWASPTPAPAQNLAAAATPAYLKVDGTTVAVVSCSEVGGFLANDDKIGMLRCSAPADACGNQGSAREG